MTEGIKIKPKWKERKSRLDSNCIHVQRSSAGPEQGQCNEVECF